MPQLKLLDVVQEVLNLMITPTSDQCCDACAGTSVSIYHYQSNPEAFNAIAQEWTRQYAM